MADISKIRLSGVTYTIVDSNALHTIDDNVTSGGTNAVKGSGVYDAITASTAAALQTVAEAGYQTSTDVQNAISGKADTTAVTADIAAAVSGKADSTAVTEEIAAAVSGKADTTAMTQALNAKYGAVEYDSNSKRINFYADSTTGTVLSYVDATDFIKDGMVDNVEIKTVTSNQWIQVPASNIASNEEPIKAFLFCDNPTSKVKLVYDLTDITEFNETEIGLNAIDDFDEGWGCSSYTEYNTSIYNEEGDFTCKSEDISMNWTSSELTVEHLSGNVINNIVLGISDPNSYITAAYRYGQVSTTVLAITFNSDAGKEEIDIPLTQIFDPNNYYDKAATDNAIAAATSGKVDTSTYETYTAATATALSGKQNTLTAGTGIDITNDVISVTSVPLTVEDEVTSGSSNPVKSSGIYNAITAATATKQDTLVNQTNIKSVGGESLLGSGNVGTLHASVGTGNDSETLILEVY